MAEPTPDTPLSSLISLSDNAHCVECQSRNPEILLCDFGVFICRACLEAAGKTGIIVRSKAIHGDIIDNFDLETAKTGGNSRFRSYFADTTDLSQRYTRSKSDFYARNLRSEVNSLQLLSAVEPEKTEEQNTVTRKIAAMMGWLEEKMKPIIEGVNERVGESDVLQKVGEWVETGYNVYEAQVHEHIESKSGLLHPIKTGVDKLTAVLDSPSGQQEIEMLELPHKPANEESARLLQDLQETEK